MPPVFENVKLGPFTPVKWEIIWLYKFLKKLNVKSVLEFGCGATTIAAMNSLSMRKNIPRYTVVENYQPNIDLVRPVYPAVEIVPKWADIPKNANYDVVIVDGSSGSISGRGVQRAEAVMFSEDLSSPEAVYILHDAHSFSGKATVTYVVSKNYTLLEWYEGKKGFAAYQKPLPSDDPMLKWKCVPAVAPRLCEPCRFCRTKTQLYSEIPVKGDHYGTGFVMRIGCLCKQSDTGDKDDARTYFHSYRDALNRWNEKQTEPIP